MRNAKGQFWFVLLASVAIFSVGARSQTTEHHLPWKITNDKVATAVSGNPKAIALLADDVLSGSLLLEQLAAVNLDLRNNLINAELAYRNKQHPGVPDKRVVTVMNTLVKKINGPSFAYTNCAEVRRLRMSLIPVVPALFARDLRPADQNGKAHIREEMSPVEALYLLARLVDQKTSNPDYQLTVQERHEKWAKLHSSLTVPASEPNSRTQELFDAVNNQAKTISPRDLALSASYVVSNLLRKQEGGK